MALVRYFGKPTFFITFTANTKWAEIVRELRPGQKATDCLDIVARVFILKVKELIKDLQAGILGPYTAYIYTIKYQKQGLLYIYLLLFLEPGFVIDIPKRINKVVYTKLPNIL